MRVRGHLCTVAAAALAAATAAAAPLACGGDFEGRAPADPSSERAASAADASADAHAEEAPLTARLLGVLDEWAHHHARDDSWELVLSGSVYRNAKRRELPEGDTVFVGLTVPLVEGEAPSPRTNVKVSALAIRRRGDDIHGKVLYFDEAAAGDKADLDAALRAAQQRFEGHDPPPLPASVQDRVRALVDQATEPLTPTKQGWLLGGDAPLEIRQLGSDLIAVGSLAGPRPGIRFSVYRPDRAAGDASGVGDAGADAAAAAAAD